MLVTLVTDVHARPGTQTNSVRLISMSVHHHLVRTEALALIGISYRKSLKNCADPDQTAPQGAV